MAARPPSAILSDLAKTHNPKKLQTILAEGLFPYLDALPEAQKKPLVALLLKTENKHRGADLIDFDAKEKSLLAAVRQLRQDVRDDPHDRYDNQVEIMESGLTVIYKWLPILWTVGVEDGLEIELVHKSLQVCKETYDALGGTDSCAEFYDLATQYKCKIKNSQGKVVYAGGHTTDHDIFWVWRDLLVASMVQDPKGRLASKLVADIQKDYTAEIMDRLDANLAYAASKDMNKSHPTIKKTDPLHNAHWSKEMHVAAPKLKKLFLTGQIASFKKRPTCELYLSIAGSSPEMKEELLDITRAYVFEVPTERADYRVGGMRPDGGEAFRIFKEAEADEDLVRILDRAPSTGLFFIHDLDNIIKAAVPYLMTRSDAMRAIARKYLQKSLRYKAASPISCFINEAFPTITSNDSDGEDSGMNDASTGWGYLQSVVDSGELTPVAGKSNLPIPAPTRYETTSKILPRAPHPQRDAIFKAFLEHSGWAPRFELNSEDEPDSEEEYYNDDYEPEEPDDLTYDHIRKLQDWVKILNSWPVEEEQAEIREFIRQSTSTPNPLFFEVDGAANALARRCDYRQGHCRQQLARAIRELYYAFAEDGDERALIERELLGPYFTPQRNASSAPRTRNLPSSSGGNSMISISHGIVLC